MRTLHEPASQLESRLASSLTIHELAAIIACLDTCATCALEADFHEAIRHFGNLIGFEFILYAHMASSYDSTGQVSLQNISNPTAWMLDYDEHRYVEHDPVRRELEVRLAAGEASGVIAWDAYERTLSAIEEEIIARRSGYGLRTGLSAYCNSPRHNALFVVSFASERTTPPDARAMLLAGLVVPHLNRCRKRLDLSCLVGQLTKREQAIAAWLADGKTNGEVAQILGIAEATVKYHVANVLTKLKTSSRQGAVAILMAERCLA